jgi:hypothetical protein
LIGNYESPGESFSVSSSPSQPNHLTYPDLPPPNAAF